MQAGTSMDVQVAGRLGIPGNAVAVVANVTAVDASGPGYLQVLPTGQAAVGSSSTLNVDFAGQTIPNASFAPLGDGGQLTVYAILTTDVVIDISGYFTPATTSSAGRLVPLTPNRILDTRIALGWTPPAAPVPPTASAPNGTVPPNPGDPLNCPDFDSWQLADDYYQTYFSYYGDVANLDPDGDGIVCEDKRGAPRTANLRTDTVAAATVITLQVAGRGGVPTSGVSAVVMNVTAVDPAGPGYVQVAPTPVVAGASSNLNTSAGRTIANLVVVPLSAGGTVDLYLTTPANLVADVVGYFTDASATSSGVGLFMPITPNRQLETRIGGAPPVAGGTITTVDVNDIATGAIAIAGNLTATEPAATGYLQLAASPIDAGASSNLNIAYPGQTIANAVVSPVAGGLLQLFNQIPTHELLDITGWFTSAAASDPPVPTTQPPTTPAPPTTPTTPAIAELSVEPSEINLAFGLNGTNLPPPAVVTVKNIGGQPTLPLRASTVGGDWDDGDPEFNLVDITTDSCADRSLAPGETCSITVAANIPFGTRTTPTLRISDGWPYDAQVVMTSTAAGPLIEHNGWRVYQIHEYYEFDPVQQDHVVTFRNIGGAPTTSLALSLGTEAFTLVGDTCTGQSVAPATTCSVTIHWNNPPREDPNDGSYVSDRVTVTGGPLTFLDSPHLELRGWAEVQNT
ncbi:MAG: hypothetical protein AB7R77_19130 [Ilumatobacteraceae bacterium]